MNDYEQNTLQEIDRHQRRAEHGLERKSAAYYEGYKQAFRDYIIDGKELPDIN